MATIKSTNKNGNKDTVLKNKKILYSLDTFIKSAKESAKYKGVSKITFAGFRSMMVQKDKRYVYDESEYVSELDKYIK